MLEEKKDQIRISVRNLVEFILRTGNIDNRHRSSYDNAMQEGSRIHRMIQKRMGSNYVAEVYLKTSRQTSDFDIIVEGRCDGILTEENKVTIDEIKGTYQDLVYLTEPYPVHVAQAKCYAYMYAREQGLSQISVRMVYCSLDTEELRYFESLHLIDDLEIWFSSVIKEYEKWARFQHEWKAKRELSIKRMEFPFTYREGQKELVSQVYRTIYHKKRLFVEAPTGVGKTISTVFPAVKAVGEGLADKIFYLTAKTITGTVAAQTLEILKCRGLSYKTLSITAKEKICLLEERECNPVACPYANGHYDRINEAIFDLLQAEDTYSRDIISEYAKKHMVCPFELGLDMSLFSDAIICDYNYVFDPNVYLRRFFAEGIKGEYIFLIDEAHNLVERGREMYSATLYKEDFLEMKKVVSAYDRKLEKYLESCNKQLLALKRECEGCQVIESISAFHASLMRAAAQMETFLEEEDSGEARKQLLDFYLRVRHFMNIYERVDENYVIYTEHETDGKFKMKLMCVHTAKNLLEFLNKGNSTIFFSATLLPVEYYMDLLGGDKNDYAVYAKSTFPQENRGVFIGTDVSTKYNRRGPMEYYNIASYVDQITRSKRGNYMVFFPSHYFLRKVYEVFRDHFMGEDTECILQDTGMTEAEREDFIQCFRENVECEEEDTLIDLAELIHMEIEIESTKTLIGFCVMGGIFSEGIDLKNDSLIGAIVVGTGLPQVCNEREILREYFDERGLNGFDYSYRFPGMNKVLQAAGRVIRTSEDVGIIALLDDRFLSPGYHSMFPLEWSNKKVMTLDKAYALSEEFWTEKDRQGE